MISTKEKIFSRLKLDNPDHYYIESMQYIMYIYIYGVWYIYQSGASLAVLFLRLQKQDPSSIAKELCTVFLPVMMVNRSSLRELPYSP